MHPYFSPPLPHVFGHRGASGEAPENTREAFELALSQGARFLEMDCHATQDGEIVILHDADVDRVTPGNGAVKEHRFAQLQQLDAGFHFSPDGRSFPYRARGVRIPRLAEILEAFPAAHINLEIKQAQPAIAEEVVRLVRRAGATQRVLLAAEQDDLMADLRELDPGTAIGFSRGDVLAFFQGLDEGFEGYRAPGHTLQIPPSFMERPLVSAESVRAAHRLGLFVHVWTVNEPREMRRLLALEVDGIMSDFPARAAQIVRAHAAVR